MKILGRLIRAFLILLSLYLGFFWIKFIIDSIIRQHLEYIPLFGVGAVVMFYNAYNLFKKYRL